MTDLLDLCEQHKHPAQGTFYRFPRAWQLFAAADLPRQAGVSVIFSCNSPRSPFPDALPANVEYMTSTFLQWWESLGVRLEKAYNGCPGYTRTDMIVKNITLHLPKTTIAPGVRWRLSTTVAISSIEAHFEHLECKRISV